MGRPPAPSWKALKLYRGRPFAVTPENAGTDLQTTRRLASKACALIGGIQTARTTLRRKCTHDSAHLERKGKKTTGIVYGLAKKTLLGRTRAANPILRSVPNNCWLVLDHSFPQHSGLGPVELGGTAWLAMAITR